VKGREVVDIEAIRRPDLAGIESDITTHEADDAQA